MLENKKDRAYIPNFDKDYYCDVSDDSLYIEIDMSLDNQGNSVVEEVVVQEEKSLVTPRIVEPVVVKEKKYCEDYWEDSSDVLCVKLSRYKASNKNK